MPIIINEFEVVPETPPPPVRPGLPATPPPLELSPRDVMDIIRHSIERAFRLRAY